MYTPPNRYWARSDWKPYLKQLEAKPGTWQFDLVTYLQHRGVGDSVQDAWKRTKMSVVNAKHALVIFCPNEWNDSSIIPPDLFSRVLVRSTGAPLDAPPPPV